MTIFGGEAVLYIAVYDHYAGCAVQHTLPWAGPEYRGRVPCMMDLDPSEAWRMGDDEVGWVCWRHQSSLDSGRTNDHKLEFVQRTKLQTFHSTWQTHPNQTLNQDLTTLSTDHTHKSSWLSNLNLAFNFRPSTESSRTTWVTHHLTISLVQPD